MSILILERSDSLKSNLGSMAPPRFDIPIAAFVLGKVPRSINLIAP